MNDEQLKIEIDNLKAEIDKLKNTNKETGNEKKKDFWIKLVSSIVLPLTIALSGYWFSQAIKTRELSFNAKQSHDRDSTESVRYQEQLQVSLKNQRLETFKFIAPLLDIMTSADPKRRSYATAIITSIMPDEGPQLLNIAINSDPENTKKYQETLNNKQSVLISNLFSENVSIRTGSANEIMVSWYKITSVVPALISYASRHMDNANGIFNTVIVLQNMHGSVLKVNKEGIRQFLKSVMELKKMEKTVSNASALNNALDKI